MGEPEQVMGYPETKGMNDQVILIFKKKRAIYIPIPKVACTSIKVALRGLSSGCGCGDPMVDPHRRNLPTVSKKDIRAKYGAFFAFAFVRNPWDRLVSCYSGKIMGMPIDGRAFKRGVAGHIRAWGHRTGHPAYKKFRAGMTFEAFVDAVCRIPDWKSDPHFRSQYCFVSLDGRMLTNKIFRFEKIDAEWARVRKKLGIESYLSKLQRSEHRPYRDYYTEELADKVAVRYIKDVAAFGYTFKGGRIG